MTNRISILGSGWLGLPLAQHFSGLGYQVKLSTRSAEKIPQLQRPLIIPLLVDIDALTDCSEFLDADMLIINITSKNQAAFALLIEQIKQSPVQKVLFISSSSVYQNLNREVNEDEGAENPESVLWRIEQQFCQQTAFQTTILRFSGLIDSRRHPGGFFRNGKIVQQADAPVNLIHLDDCVGIIDAIIAQQAWGEVFNGCADSHPTKRQFYSFARLLLGEAPPLFAENQPLNYKIVSNAKVKKKLNYQFQRPDLMTINF